MKLKITDIRWKMVAAAFSLAACTSKSQIDLERSVPGPAPKAVAPDALLQAETAKPQRAPRPEEDISVRLQRELDAAATTDATASRQVDSVRPVLKCVEQASNHEWRAHFGYRNQTSKGISIPVGFHNRFWPPPIGQGQPTIFEAGTKADVVNVPFVDGGSAAWVLGQSFVLARPASIRCPAAKTAARQRSHQKQRR